MTGWSTRSWSLFHYFVSASSFFLNEVNSLDLTPKNYEVRFFIANFFINFKSIFSSHSVSASIFPRFNSSTYHFHINHKNRRSVSFNRRQRNHFHLLKTDKFWIYNDKRRERERKKKNTRSSIFIFGVWTPANLFTYLKFFFLFNLYVCVFIFCFLLGSW